MTIEEEHAIMKAALIRISKLDGTYGTEYDFKYGKYRIKNGDEWSEGAIGKGMFANDLARNVLKELK